MFLRVIFDDYIMTRSTYKELENNKTAQGQTGFCASLFLFFRCFDGQFIAFKFKKTVMLEFYVGKPWTIITCDFYCWFNRFLTYIFSIFLVSRTQYFLLKGYPE